jgi:hypothetical protein
MKKILSFILFVVITATSYSQTKYFIKNNFTSDPIPFVKITPNLGSPFLGDIDGVIIINEDVTTFEIKGNGVKDSLIVLANVIDFTIYLTPLIKEIQVVNVTAGENPAHRIIDLAIENRKKNNPLDNDAFRYESYSKFIFDANQEAIDSIPANTTDSTLLKIKSFFTSQYLFMMESASIRTFIPPSRDKEEITAYKVSGFNNPMFSTFANELQSFSFYENQFQLLGKTYINPIAFGGTRRYLFIIEDTTVINQDTTFTIFYRPRKGKNFEGMTGHLYINTKGYAIEKVTASPYEDTTGMSIMIVQEYLLIGGEKWFPSKLSTEIAFKSILLNPKMKDSYIQGKGSTYIKNIELNPDGLRKRDFDNVSVTTDENAGEVKDDAWDSLRVYSINEKEKRTYEMVDSLSKAENFDKKLALLNILAQGKVPLGYFNLDLTKVIDFDLYQRYRFGIGLETSKKMMKNATIGGYYAWATRDNEFKYGGFSTIHLNRKNGIKINLRYQQDVAERGGTFYQKDLFSLNSTSMYRHLFIQNMDKQRLGELAFSGNVNSNMKITLIGNYQRIWATEEYTYYPLGDLTIMEPITEFDLAETALEFSWNIREKVMLLGNNRISKGTKYPKIKFKVTKGWKRWFESDFDYVRINTEIQQDISIRGIGKFSWTLAGSLTNGNVPLFLMNVGIGTGRNWNLSVMNTFETMKPSEFYSTKQAALFTRLNFNAIKTKAKWNEPQFCVHHAIGYGEMNQKLQHSVSIQSMDKGFFEGGIILNNILVANSMGIGIGGFYRYGSYSDSDWKKNIVPKITLSVAL